MILAVLTTFFSLSGIVMYNSIKGAIAVDEHLSPVKETIDTEQTKKPRARSRSMVFLDFSRSRNIA
jgi:hypothetical protein